MRATIPALTRQNSPIWSFEKFLNEEKSPVQKQMLLHKKDDFKVKKNQKIKPLNMAEMPIIKGVYDVWSQYRDLNPWSQPYQLKNIFENYNPMS